MREGTGWSTTLVGHMPRGERSTTKELIELAIPILWEIGGTERFRQTDDGFHVTAFRVGGDRHCVFGDFFYESRSITLDLGLIRGNVGTRWRRYTLSMLAHEMVHARQFLRSPKTYDQKYPWRFSTYTEYWNSPGEIEARKEESLVRVALGLAPLFHTPVRGRRKERLEAYRHAFNQEILPCIKAIEGGAVSVGGRPNRSIPLLRTDKAEIVEDLIKYSGKRKINRLNSTELDRAARLWRYTRGWHIEDALIARTGEQKTAWLEDGCARRQARAYLADSLPAAAADMARNNWSTPFDKQLKAWDENLLEGYTFLLRGRIIGLEQIYRRLENA